MKKLLYLFVATSVLFYSCQPDNPAPNNPNNPNNPADTTNNDGTEGNNPTTVYQVGDPLDGGVVAYIPPGGDGSHGLIVSPHEFSSAWSNVLDMASMAMSDNDGVTNTQLIVNQPGHTNSAAKMCLDYQNDGFSDWYLPSINEVKKIMENQEAINVGMNAILGAEIEIFGFQPTLLSSTEIDSASVYAYYSINPQKAGHYEKNRIISFRPVRKF